MFTGIVTDLGRVRSIERPGDTRFVIETSYDTAEIEILKRSRQNEVERALGLLDSVRNGSRHLGHNLANVANEISSYDARIEQTEKILRDLVNRAAFAGGAR